MAIAFTYTESTNTVVVTGGTSGTPATFADFVTADRAGTDTSLLSAGSPANDLALTYAVRPVEDLAIKVKCVVANKTAEADHIFITGTDWHGDAQTEAIDITAGNGSYETTKYWASITTLDCSDNAAGGGTVWADGDLTVTQDVWGVIWDYGNGQYQVDCRLDFGNASTATYFKSENEMVVFNEYVFYVTSQANVRMGALTNSQPVNGSTWKITGSSTYWNLSNDGAYSTFGIYASTIVYNNNNHWQWDTEVIVEDSKIIYLVSTNLGFNVADVSINTLRVVGANPVFEATPTKLEGFWIDASPGYGSIAQQGTAEVTVISPTVTNTVHPGYTYRNKSTNDLTVVSPNVEPSTATCTIDEGKGDILLKYPINIHVVDKDGANLQSVTVLCEDDDDADIFSESTDASGDISEQTITVKSWTGTSETEDDNNPFKFTISKSGYETLTLENITVDGPIDWHLELQSQKQPPTPWQEGMM